MPLHRNAPTRNLPPGVSRTPVFREVPSPEPGIPSPKGHPGEFQTRATTGLSDRGRGRGRVGERVFLRRATSERRAASDRLLPRFAAATAPEAPGGTRPRASPSRHRGRAPLCSGGPGARRAVRRSRRGDVGAGGAPRVGRRTPPGDPRAWVARLAHAGADPRHGTSGSPGLRWLRLRTRAVQDRTSPRVRR